MKLVRGLGKLGTAETGRVVAIGAFDGVHLGHQAILRAAVSDARASGLQSAAVTFEPHPEVVLRPGGAPPLLTPLEEKAELIEALGLDLLVVVEFTPEFARTPAEEFVEGVLAGGLKARVVLVGYDFTFGHAARGNAELLRQLSRGLGLRVVVFSPVRLDGVPVSSTAVRQLLAAGDVARAARLLGRFHSVTGRVTRGAGVGTGLGVPTANLALAPGLAVPARGVYAAWAELLEAGHRWYPGVVNVGYRPTFGGRDLGVEAHLIDFSADVLGVRLRLHFVTRLRDEQRFESPRALAEQIARDVAAGRDLLARQPPPARRIPGAEPFVARG